MLVHPQTRETASTTHRMRQAEAAPSKPMFGGGGTNDSPTHLQHIHLILHFPNDSTVSIQKQLQTQWHLVEISTFNIPCNASIYHTLSPFLPPTVTPCPSPGDRITAQAPLLEKVASRVSRCFKELRRSSTRFSIHHPLVHQNLGHPCSWEPLGKICRLVYCFGDLWFSADPLQNWFLVKNISTNCPMWCVCALHWQHSKAQWSSYVFRQRYREPRQQMFKVQTRGSTTTTTALLHKRLRTSANTDSQQQYSKISNKELPQKCKQSHKNASIPWNSLNDYTADIVSKSSDDFFFWLSLQRPKSFSNGVIHFATLPAIRWSPPNRFCTAHFHRIGGKPEDSIYSRYTACVFYETKPPRPSRWPHDNKTSGFRPMHNRRNHRYCFCYNQSSNGLSSHSQIHAIIKYWQQ